MEIEEKTEQLNMQYQALEFTKESLESSNDPTEIFKLVYNLKLELLKTQVNWAKERQRLMDQAKKREKEHAERIQHALDSQAELSAAYEKSIKSLEEQLKFYQNKL